MEKKAWDEKHTMLWTYTSQAEKLEVVEWRSHHGPMKPPAKVKKKIEKSKKKNPNSWKKTLHASETHMSRECVHRGAEKQKNQKSFKTTCWQVKSGYPAENVEKGKKRRRKRKIKQKISEKLLKRLSKSSTGHPRSKNYSRKEEKRWAEPFREEMPNNHAGICAFPYPRISCASPAGLACNRIDMVLWTELWRRNAEGVYVNKKWSKRRCLQRSLDCNSSTSTTSYRYISIPCGYRVWSGGSGMSTTPSPWKGPSPWEVWHPSSHWDTWDV